MNIETLFDLLTLISAGVVLLALVLAWRWRRFRLPALFIIGTASCVGSVSFWYNHRPLPDDVRRTLFPGVQYERIVRTDVPMIAHVVRLDLDTHGLRFFVTPSTPTEDHDQVARTTSQFLTEFGLQLAINADFYDPWRDNGIFDYYPHVGDPVSLRGLTASEGDVYTHGYSSSYDTLNIAVDNSVSFGSAPNVPYNAVSGNFLLLVNGVIGEWIGVDSYLQDRHPRTVVALDKSGDTLLFILVDGRQPNYSEGATIAELAALTREVGGWTAINLDGGGSTTLVIEQTDGQPTILNSPIHNRIPGRERPIASHLGVYIERES